ncbi:MAG: hypothetical protein ACJ76N_03935, partial [Thermoanaerobaculia bacterium]
MDTPAETFRISVRTTDRGELERAVEILSRFKADEVHRYDGLVTGLADRGVVRELMAAGLIVDRSSDVAKAPAPATPAAMAAPAEAADAAAPAEEESPVLQRIRQRAEEYARSRPVRHRVLGMTAAAPPPPRPPEVFEVRLLGPMRPEWGAFFNGHGIRVTSYVPPYRYRMPLTEEQVEAVRAQEFVTAVEPYSLAETLS